MGSEWDNSPVGRWDYSHEGGRNGLSQACPLPHVLQGPTDLTGKFCWTQSWHELPWLKAVWLFINVNRVEASALAFPPVPRSFNASVPPHRWCRLRCHQPRWCRSNCVGMVPVLYPFQSRAYNCPATRILVEHDYDVILIRLEIEVVENWSLSFKD